MERGKEREREKQTETVTEKKVPVSPLNGFLLVINGVTHQLTARGRQCLTIPGWCLWFRPNDRAKVGNGGRERIERTLVPLDGVDSLTFRTLVLIWPGFGGVLGCKGRLSICLSACLSVYLSPCLSDAVSAYLLVCLSLPTTHVLISSSLSA